MLYETIDVREELPGEKGWFNLTTDGSPSPCGRAWFDGKKFSLDSKQHDYRGLLANGWKLFWLKPVTAKPLLSDEEILKVAKNKYVKHTEYRLLFSSGARFSRSHYESYLLQNVVSKERIIEELYKNIKAKGVWEGENEAATSILQLVREEDKKKQVGFAEWCYENSWIFFKVKAQWMGIENWATTAELYSIYEQSIKP